MSRVLTSWRKLTITSSVLVFMNQICTRRINCAWRYLWNDSPHSLGWSSLFLRPRMYGKVEDHLQKHRLCIYQTLVLVQVFIMFWPHLYFKEAKQTSCGLIIEKLLYLLNASFTESKHVAIQFKDIASEMEAGSNLDLYLLSPQCS